MVVHEPVRHVSFPLSPPPSAQTINAVNRSMSLWVYDNTLVQALDLCKSFLVTLDILSALWPCPGKVLHISTSMYPVILTLSVTAQQKQYRALRDELTINCEKARLPPPPPSDFTLPISLRL